jgi:hypothetical protein
VFFLVSCFDARGLVTRPILPVNLSFTFEFAEGASLGINLLGILLFAVFRTRLGRQPRVSAGEQALHRGAI